MILYYAALQFVCAVDHLEKPIMTKPLVAITSDYKEVEPYMWHATPAPYIDAAVQVSEVMPVIIPSIADRLEANALLDRIDGLLVTGSRSMYIRPITARRSPKIMNHSTRHATPPLCHSFAPH